MKNAPTAKTVQEQQPTERWARLEVWSETLCLPLRYIREKLQGVIVERRVLDREGRLHQSAQTVREADVAAKVSEYQFVKELLQTGKNRADIRRAIFIDVLARAGYQDWLSLKRVNPHVFESQEFRPYGRGKAFHTAVTGKSTGTIRREEILNIARLLGLPGQTVEKQIAEFRCILSLAGYPDRISLQLLKTSMFASQEFPPYGKGKAFYAAVTGKRLGKQDLRREHLVEIADAVEYLAPTQEERIAKFRDILSCAGYPDRISLERALSTTFIVQQFPPYGKGRGFYVVVMGKSIGTHNFTKEHILEIADALEL